MRTPWQVDDGGENRGRICFPGQHHALAALSASVPLQSGLAPSKVTLPIPARVLTFWGCTRGFSIRYVGAGAQPGPRGSFSPPDGFSRAEGHCCHFPAQQAALLAQSIPPPRAGAESVPKQRFLFPWKLLCKYSASELKIFP